MDDWRERIQACEDGQRHWRCHEAAGLVIRCHTLHDDTGLPNNRRMQFVPEVNKVVAVVAAVWVERRDEGAVINSATNLGPERWGRPALAPKADPCVRPTCGSACVAVRA